MSDNQEVTSIFKIPAGGAYTYGVIEWYDSHSDWINSRGDSGWRTKETIINTYMVTPAAQEWVDKGSRVKQYQPSKWWRFWKRKEFVTVRLVGSITTESFFEGKTVQKI